MIHNFDPSVHLSLLCSPILMILYIVWYIVTVILLQSTLKTTFWTISWDSEWVYLGLRCASSKLVIFWTCSASEACFCFFILDRPLCLQLAEMPIFFVLLSKSLNSTSWKSNLLWNLSLGETQLMCCNYLKSRCCAQCCHGVWPVTRNAATTSPLYQSFIISHSVLSLLLTCISFS